MNKRKNFSHKRQAVFDAICNTNTHPDAEWIYKKLKNDFPKLSLGTVYRNISEFKEGGDVSSVAVVGGIERIDGNTKPHPHFICKACNSVIDVEVDFSSDGLCSGLADKYGFECERAELTFWGRCNKCIEAKEA